MFSKKSNINLKYSDSQICFSRRCVKDLFCDADRRCQSVGSSGSKISKYSERPTRRPSHD